MGKRDGDEYNLTKKEDFVFFFSSTTITLKLSIDLGVALDAVGLFFGVTQTHAVNRYKVCMNKMYYDTR